MAANQQQIADALREYLLTKERSQRDIAQKIGKSPAHISNYLRGAERISRQVAERIVELWPEIRLAFLLSGDGPLLHGQSVQHLDHVTIGGNNMNGSTINGDQALALENAQLREQLAKAQAEKDRLLGIIDNLTKK